MDWPEPLRLELLARLKASGHPADQIDPSLAFQHVRLLILEAGETLLEAGAPASLVYIPLDRGLKILPQGGYRSFMVQPWMLLGLTGVIRGAERNASIIAEQTVRLLAIPKMVYLRHWHKTLSPEAFRSALATLQPEEAARAGTGNLLDKTLLLQKLPFFHNLEAEALIEIAAQVQLIEAPAGRRVCSQGEAANCLFLVVDGALEEERDGRAVGRLAVQDLFGVTGALAAAVYRTTVMAKDDSRLLRLDREVTGRLLEENKLFARAVIDRLARSIAAQTQDLEGAK